MPAFGQRLTAQEIDDLVAYILTLRTNAEPTFTHWWEPVPTR
jgi:mono/diheme cytochrome c family protein